jgi:hypothetical protein
MGYKISRKQKRSLKSQYRHKASDDGRQVSKREWSFKEGDLVELNNRGAGNLGIEAGVWGVVVDGSIGDGYFKVLTSFGVQDWNGSWMYRVQKMATPV